MHINLQGSCAVQRPLGGPRLPQPPRLPAISFANSYGLPQPLWGCPSWRRAQSTRAPEESPEQRQPAQSTRGEPSPYFPDLFGKVLESLPRLPRPVRQSLGATSQTSQTSHNSSPNSWSHFPAFPEFPPKLLDPGFSGPSLAILGNPSNPPRDPGAEQPGSSQEQPRAAMSLSVSLCLCLSALRHPRFYGPPLAILGNPQPS